MKFNLGSGNNFILKNSNIVIQQAPSGMPPKDQPHRANSQGQRKANQANNPVYKYDQNTAGTPQFNQTKLGATGFNSTKQRRAGNLAPGPQEPNANFKVMQNYTGGALNT